MAGNVSRKKVASVIKNSTHTDDVAERDVTTSKTASLDHLVGASDLQLETAESVVLASDADTDVAYLAELKFNEEPVEITIAEDSSEFPIDPVALSNNGKQIYVKRGEATRIPRKFVECLCNPVMRVRTKQVKNNMGEDATVLERTRSLQFPFQLNEVNGATPKTRAWLRSLLTRE